MKHSFLDLLQGCPLLSRRLATPVPCKSTYLSCSSFSRLQTQRSAMARTQLNPGNKARLRVVERVHTNLRPNQMVDADYPVGAARSTRATQARAVSFKRRSVIFFFFGFSFLFASLRFVFTLDTPPPAPVWQSATCQRPNPTRLRNARPSASHHAYRFYCCGGACMLRECRFSSQGLKPSLIPAPSCALTLFLCDANPFPNFAPNIRRDTPPGGRLGCAVRIHNS
ncbi:hypothetical protein DFH08DRAFT_326877 [Mycena albidolilacea]|uniref:Transmembrane protein n=1 Tax=Mycena albidolilacea TaxID=1033008 RepID=A0AAD7F0R0_9AGAR|nr:hypothetical protein DFH08DRAFT_326877 [Mycena albidolilacea]